MGQLSGFRYREVDPGDLPEGTLRAILKQAGISPEDFDFARPNWRRGVIVLFLQKGLLNPDFARKRLCGERSGFSIDRGTRIRDQDPRCPQARFRVRHGCPSIRTSYSPTSLEPQEAVNPIWYVKRLADHTMR
jgi:hypothetical protein